MSSEESYLAIQRYLTDEREPYAPGTQGNAKRKIRKAAACYVVRDGTLYYQRRQKGLDEFTELEVVLQAGRRKELIDEAHIVPGGEHLNQQQTWESISQKYWWRGILKQVKDYIRECSQCRGRQERGRGWVEEAAGETAGGRRERRRGTAAPDSEDEEDEEDDEIPELLPVTSGQQKSARSRKSMAKHELVFVDSKGVVKQPLPKHGQTLLEKLNQQRLNGQFCDVTLLIEGEEHRAHKAVLAACSDYFSELFIEKGAVSSHEAVVDLSGFSKASFLPLLEFAYTSCLTFNFCIMAEVATVARHLLMTEVLQLCESVHKQVEEQRLMVYQRGDVHTVLSSQSLPPSQQASVEEGDVYMVTVQDNGQTMSSEALVIGVDPQKSVSAKASDPALTRASDPPLSAEPPPQPQPVRRRPGRPAKVRPVLLHSGDPSAPVTKAPAGSATPEPADGGAGAVDDTYKGRLRRRSLGEGGYVRLHMGLERPEEQKSEEGAAAPEHVGGASGEHKCAECGLVFQRRYALIMHTLKHEKTRGYKCSLCSKDFQYAASLRAHIARHKRQKSQRASVAPRAPSEAADSSGDSEEGRSRIRTRREFVCDICGKTLPKLYSLRIHMLHHTGVRPHSCKVCGKSFAHKHSLKMHRALHDSMRQFQCTLCDKSFVSKRSLEEHTSIHTGESKYLCTTCGKPFHRASGLSKHLKRHQPRPEVRAFPCSHCDKSFYEAKDLQQHMNKHLGLKPFQCQVCGKCYSWKKDWYSHVKSHSVAEPFRCNICGKEFFEKALFRRHVKKATHGKKGRVKQNLERECEHCGRKFTQLREYRRHMNNHQGVKPFECLTCGVAWADARSLKRHVRTHTGERPYVCPVCQDAHIDARTLRKHMVKYHGDYLPGKIMLEKDTLQFHNQGTQVEHAISILAPELPPELQAAHASAGEEIETALVTEETVEAVQAVSEMPVDGGAVSTLSDQSIMQVVNYVLAQRATQPGGGKLEEHAGDVIHTVEVEVAHVAEVE
uniref:Zinc finger and BTB domain containing 11 n=1 Tax=Paramormyrops kingsleyae TaxID=1676925 RepID=A0A3B3SFM5_9TELE